MKVSPHVRLLPLAAEHGTIYPVLLCNPGLVLVDAGYPLQIDLLRAGVESQGYRLANIEAVLLTHQDLDHIGCVKELKALNPQLKVMAHRIEAPYIDGRETPVKLSAMDSSNPFYGTFKAGFDNRRLGIDRLLEDGDPLIYGGGITVIHTPGHTPGHVCLYVKADKLLIAGDALNLMDGQLQGPNPRYTQDMAQATASLAKLAGYDIQRVIAYHGGLYEGEVKVAQA